ncbi:MAG: hypothetical protein QXO76_04640 [Thermoproteota archaeon]
MFKTRSKPSGVHSSVFYVTANLALFFCFLQAVNQLGLTYLETLHRVTVNTVIDATVFSREADFFATLILLATLLLLQLPAVHASSRSDGFRIYAPVLLTMLSLIFFLLGEARIVFILILFSTLTHVKRYLSLWGFANTTVLLTIILSLASLARWLSYPFLTTPFYMDASWVPSKVDRAVFYFLNNTLAFWLVTMLILGWLLSLVSTFLRRVRLVKTGRGRIGLLVQDVQEEGLHRLTQGVEKSRLLKTLLDWRLALPLSIIVLLFLNYYNYFPSVNPEGKPVSVDILYTYVPRLERFESYGLTFAGVEYLFTEWHRRPFVMLSLFLLKFLTGFSSVDTVKLSLFLAGVLHVASTFLAFRLVTGDRMLSTASVYFATFSVTTVVGLFAGYLGMWVSASFQLLSIAFLTRAVGDECFRMVVPAVLFSALALLSHPWSWLLFSLAAFTLPVALFFLGRLGVCRRLGRRQFLIMAVFLLFQLVPEVLALVLFNPPSLVKLVSDALKWGGFSFANLFLYETNVNRMLNIYVGGFSSNWLIYALSVVGAVSLLKYDNHFLTFILAALLVSTPVFFLCNHGPQTRIIYFLPLQAASTIGFFEALRLAKGRISPAACFSAIILMLANYAFRSVANLI